MSKDKCPIQETCVHYHEGCYYMACCAREKIADLQSQLDKHRWIPVEQGLPEVKKPVWVVDYKRNVWQAELLINQRFYSEETQHELHTITHWQEIILPEKEKGLTDETR